MHQLSIRSLFRSKQKLEPAAPFQIRLYQVKRYVILT